MTHHRPRSDQILVGTHLVRLVGLREALKEASSHDLSGGEAAGDLLLEVLSAENYIPDGREDLYRKALQREYLRFLGEDFPAYLPGSP